MRNSLTLILGLVVATALALVIGWRLFRNNSAVNMRAIPDIEDPRLTFRTPYRNVRPEVQYVGDAVCTGCHRTVADHYHQHPMGRSLAPISSLTSTATPKLPLTASFDALGLHFSVEPRGQGFVHREICRNSRGEVIAEQEAEVLFVLGSGTRGYTLLVGDRGYLYQSPISWYSEKKIWDLSPGYREENRHFDRPITNGCLYCHANQVAAVDHTDNRYREPLFQGGHAIGCERCHGPGELHVNLRQDGYKLTGEIDDTIVNPRRLEPALRDAVCQQCHLQGQALILRTGRQFSDYRPGLPIHLFWNAFVWREGYDPNKKFLGQVEQIAASKCCRESRGRLGCTSCHDPHVQPTAEEKVAYFRQRCLSCHEQRCPCSMPAEARRMVNRDDSCAACHMPRSKTEIAHIANTDHRLLRRPVSESPPTKPLSALAPDEAILVPFHLGVEEQGDPETHRALGIALTQITAKNFPDPLRRSLAEQALRLLERAPEDPIALESRGDALLLLGRLPEALSTYESAVERAPWRDYGMLQAARVAEQLGRPAAALDFCQRALGVRPWLWLHQYHVARQLANARDWTGALSHCQEAIRLNPFIVEVRLLQVRCLAAGGRKHEARTAFEALQALAPARAEELRRRLEPLLR